MTHPPNPYQNLAPLIIHNLLQKQQSQQLPSTIIPMPKNKLIKTPKPIETKSTCSEETNESELSVASSKRANPYLLGFQKPAQSKIPIKESPSNHIDEEEDEEDDDDDEEPNHPKVKKVRVQKFYEVIYDNDKVYKYEDDPLEYKRARK